MSLVRVRRDRPVSVMDCAQTGSTAPESVSATRTSMGRPVNPVRAENTEFTVIKVNEAH